MGSRVILPEPDSQAVRESADDGHKDDGDQRVEERVHLK
jgi:hypothetical protein